LIDLTSWLLSAFIRNNATSDNRLHFIAALYDKVDKINMSNVSKRGTICIGA